MTRRGGLSPLSRDHHIPLRRQLAADLEAGIRDGHVRPGAPLPSSRDLARRLGVDRRTVGAALARLRRRNLIDLGKGQRPRASMRPRPLRPPPAVEMVPRAAALDLLRRAHAGGLSRWRLLNELEQIVGEPRSPDPHPVTLCEPRAGLRAVLAAELEEACGFAVHAVDSARKMPEDAPVILRRELLSRMRRSGTVECVPISLAGAPANANSSDAEYAVDSSCFSPAARPCASSPRNSPPGTSLSESASRLSTRVSTRRPCSEP